MGSVAIELKAGNVLTESADVLVLKYAQAPYGVDAVVTRALEIEGSMVQAPPPWGFRFVKSPSAVAASRVLFVGVPPLREFAYREIREFSRKALASLAGEAPETKHVLFTVHGAGYGLDEVEAFSAEVAGLAEAIRERDYPEGLQKISIVERNAGRADRLSSALNTLVPGRVLAESGIVVSAQSEDSSGGNAVSERLRSVGYDSDAKPHVFVAMPFKDEMDDVYHYGIQSAVKSAGLLCERADLSTFTGNVIEWVKERIKSASLVIADLTGANANVYLEVGFAWGAGIPTVLISKTTDDLKFDTRGQRCLIYKKIKDLEDSLSNELKSLKTAGPI